MLLQPIPNTFLILVISTGSALFRYFFVRHFFFSHILHQKKSEIPSSIMCICICCVLKYSLFPIHIRGTLSIYIFCTRRIHIQQANSHSASKFIFSKQFTAASNSPQQAIHLSICTRTSNNQFGTKHKVKATNYRYRKELQTWDSASGRFRRESRPATEQSV